MPLTAKIATPSGHFREPAQAAFGSCGVSDGRRCDEGAGSMIRVSSSSESGVARRRPCSGLQERSGNEPREIDESGRPHDVGCEMRALNDPRRAHEEPGRQAEQEEQQRGSFSTPKEEKTGGHEVEAHRRMPAWETNGRGDQTWETRPGDRPALRRNRQPRAVADVPSSPSCRD